MAILNISNTFEAWDLPFHKLIHLLQSSSSSTLRRSHIIANIANGLRAPTQDDIQSIQLSDELIIQFNSDRFLYYSFGSPSYFDIINGAKAMSFKNSTTTWKGFYVVAKPNSATFALVDSLCTVSRHDIFDVISVRHSQQPDKSFSRTAVYYESVRGTFSVLVGEGLQALTLHRNRDIDKCDEMDIALQLAWQYNRWILLCCCSAATDLALTAVKLPRQQ